MLCESGTEQMLNIPERHYESKLDGTRAKIGKVNNTIDIVNRRGIHYRKRLIEIDQELERFPDNTIVDCEIVAFNKKGEVDFTRSQRRCANHSSAVRAVIGDVYAMVFDVLMIRDKDVRSLPYLERKNLLSDFIKELNPTYLRYVQHHENGKDLYAKEPEGVIAKNVSSPYILGRTYAWLKIKHVTDIICNVVGYTRGEGKRGGWFGTLVLADPETGAYIGKSGGGFSDQQSEQVTQLLQKCRTNKIPFRHYQGDPFIPVETNLQVEVTFQNWTENHIMRMPRMKRILLPTPQRTL